MLELPDSWVWDCWLADDGRQFHLFFLFASRALHDPQLRHQRAGIGHAVSADLRTWTRLPDALVRSDGPAFDDVATWTGSVVRAPDGTWIMFYTGASSSDGKLVQRIGMATSTDLTTWHKHVGNPILEADPRWYEKLGESTWPDEAFRDPWVFPDPDGRGWHMLITARANHGPTDERGVIGHATSPDLRTWTVQPPLSRPGAGFGQLEVPQLAEVDSRAVLVFSCLPEEYSNDRRRRPDRAGIWALPVDNALGPYDVRAAHPLTDTSLYAGRLIHDRGGQPVLVAFHNDDALAGFVGATSDPLAVHWTADGRLATTTRHPTRCAEEQ